jgi:hypothetical protein
MTRITCDAALREKLHGLRRTLTLCDEFGRELAMVLPPIDTDRDGLEPRWIPLSEFGDGPAPRVFCGTEERAALRDFVEELELCDESGRVLARVVPTPETCASAEPQMTRAELKRRFAPGRRTFTTAEVLAYLHRL